MTTERFHDTQDGFAVLGLRNDAVEVRIVPALGARIVALRDRRHQREWLWLPHPGARLAAAALGASFEASGHGGIDDCLPTIGACRWQGRALPDHGEVWSSACTVVASADPLSICTTLRLPVSPFFLERTVSLTGRDLTIDYRLRNEGNAEEAFVWAWHPLLALRAGDRLVLPRSRGELRLETAGGNTVGQRGDRWLLPQLPAGVDLATMSLGQNTADWVKGFLALETPEAEPAVASIHGAGGETFQLEWAPAQNPWMGLWLSRGYQGWHHVALEPTNGAPDRLDHAVRDWRAHGSLPARGTSRWSIRVRL